MPQVGVNCSVFMLCSFSGDKLSLDGKHTLAMNAWKEQLKRFQGRGSFIMVVFFTMVIFFIMVTFWVGVVCGGWGGVG